MGEAAWVSLVEPRRLQGLLHHQRPGREPHRQGRVAHSLPASPLPRTSRRLLQVEEARCQNQAALCVQLMSPSLRWPLGGMEGFGGNWLQSYSIITTESNELMASVHERMPVILQPADYTRWLIREPGSAQGMGHGDSPRPPASL